MKLDRVQLSNFRNIAQATIHPSSALTLVIGRNGSGKSSLLEAMYYLGFGRSFRTNKHQAVISHDESSFAVFANCIQENGDKIGLGIERTRTDEFRCSVNGAHSRKLSDLVSKVPVQLFTPQSTDLLLGSPSERRKFCDWGLFHVEQSYGELHRNYGVLLKQRNALLKQGKSLVAQNGSYWHSQLLNYGERLDAFRSRYVESIIPVFNKISREFLPEFCLEISYHKGWEKGSTLAEALVKKADYDMRIGHTSSGPHKADLRFRVDGINASEVLSRGQLRMAVAALQLSQTVLFSEQSGRKSIFLLDDVGAELDIEKRERFIDGLLEQETQVFVTAIESQQLEFVSKYNDKKRFHVEHGHVTEE